MASMVATCSVLVSTPRRPRLIPLSPNPKPPMTFPHLIQTPALARCLKVRGFRAWLPAMKESVGPYNNNSRRRDCWKRPVAQDQSELGPAQEISGITNSLLKIDDSIRSFVFGDGNPNKGVHEETRWKLIEQYIASKGGVVAAEELAPYLDGLKSSKKTEGSQINEEKFMVPFLERFEGHAVNDEDGNVLYRFMSLQTEDKEFQDVKRKFFTEKEWQFSKTSYFERVKVVLSGIALREILFYHTTEWALKIIRSSTMTNITTMLFAALMLLHISIISFFVLIPLFRFMLFSPIYLYKNAGIRKRNRARQAAAEALESPDDLLLRQKIASARNMAGIFKC